MTALVPRMIPTETRELTLRHVLRVLHGGTGLPLQRFTAELAEPAWSGWVMRVRPGQVLLSADAAETPPPTTALRLATREAGVALPPSPPAPPDRVAEQDVTIAAADADSEVDFAPVELTLEVELVRSGSSAQPPSVVRAEGTGVSVALPHVSGSLYRAQRRTWPRAGLPYTLFVDGTARRPIAFDYTHPVTRLRVIDP